MAAELLSVDGGILLWFQDSVRNPVLTPVMRFLSMIADSGICWIILTLILLIFARTRRAGFCSMIALLLSLLLCNILLKNLVARIRPYEVVEGLSILVNRPHDFSFPSGHTSASFASATALALTLPERRRRLPGALLLLLALLIAVSRLYVGVHYPTDVLAGGVIGLVCGFIGARSGLMLADRIPWVRDRL